MIKQNIIIIMLLIVTILIFICFYIISRYKSNEIVDPSLYMNDKLKPADQLRVKIHASHHKVNDVKKLVKNLESGKTWKESHKILKPVGLFHHLSHIDVEIMSLFLKSLSVTVGLLSYYFLRGILEYYSPKNFYLKAWFWSASILLILIIFSFGIMSIKHYLSFRTFNENLLYI